MGVCTPDPRLDVGGVDGYVHRSAFRHGDLGNFDTGGGFDRPEEGQDGVGLGAVAWLGVWSDGNLKRMDQHAREHWRRSVPVGVI